MSDSVDILKKLALQVRNASTEGENTAERIGRIFIGILENMDNSDIEKLTKYFLRKDKEDSTNFLLSLLGGVLIKNYANGMVVTDETFAGKGAADYGKNTGNQNINALL